jgi:hypothetical protein
VTTLGGVVEVLDEGVVVLVEVVFLEQARNIKVKINMKYTFFKFSYLNI